MNVTTFIQRLQDAERAKTLYVLGCCGAPLNAGNKTRYKKAQSYNNKEPRKSKIDAANADTFGFDCVCLIKSILWGWTGNKNLPYGGANVYSNNVPDIDADTMISKCTKVSTDFSTIKPGEAVWLPGHIGVYIGNDDIIECTPIWDDGVQITHIKTGTHRRKWQKHGFLPWVDYNSSYTAPQVGAKPAEKANELITKYTAKVNLALDVINGKYGVGEERKKKINALGYNYYEIQNLVNYLLEV